MTGHLTDTPPQSLPGKVKPAGRIVLAGGSGFLGVLLSRHFVQRGCDVVVLTRRTPPGTPPVPGARYVRWDGDHPGAWAGELEGAKLLINLAGKSVNCRYHNRNRRELISSRILPTQLLGRIIRDCKNPPAIWMNASTATLYRHTYDKCWTEDGAIGPHPDAKDAFSVELATAWEDAFCKAETPTVLPSPSRRFLKQSKI